MKHIDITSYRLTRSRSLSGEYNDRKGLLRVAKRTHARAVRHEGKAQVREAALSF